MEKTGSGRTQGDLCGSPREEPEPGTLCLDALESALSRDTRDFQYRPGQPIYQQGGITISQDGRSRALDNVFMERLWRSLKYEEVYLKSYRSVPEVIQGIGDYFRFYNHDRLHQWLDYQTPAMVHRKDNASL